VGALAARDVVVARLLIAVGLSAALHLSFIYGVAPRPGAQARPIVPLAARLVPDPVPVTPLTNGKHVVPAPPRGATPALRPALTIPASAPESPLVAVPASNGAEAVERREVSALPKADLPFPVDLQWYEARDLDTYPRALSSLDAPYPLGAQIDAVRGTVTLLLSIDESGRVRDASVVSAEPPGYFETAALASAREAQFAPAEKDGHPVRSKIIVKLRFAPREQAAR
jgi:protein TonB